MVSTRLAPGGDEIDANHRRHRRASAEIAVPRLNLDYESATPNRLRRACPGQARPRRFRVRRSVLKSRIPGSGLVAGPERQGLLRALRAYRLGFQMIGISW
jgi:hypothetical protein